jgi:hypothetical protein
MVREIGRIARHHATLRRRSAQAEDREVTDGEPEVAIRRIPANLFASSVIINITETTLAPPAGYVDASPVYDIEAVPAGTILPQPVPVSLPFETSTGSISQQLSIYASIDGVQYTRVQDSYINAGFLQGSLSKFGYIFAGYPMSAAELATCVASGAAP